MGTDTPAHGHDPCKRRDALRRALAGWQLNVDNHDSRRLILVQEVHLQPEMNAARTQWLQGFWRPRPPAHLRTAPPRIEVNRHHGWRQPDWCYRRPRCQRLQSMNSDSLGVGDFEVRGPGTARAR